MATKQEWLDNLKLQAQWVKDMRKWVKRQPDGEIVIPDVETQDAPPQDPPPIKPPNP